MLTLPLDQNILAAVASPARSIYKPVVVLEEDEDHIKQRSQQEPDLILEGEDLIERFWKSVLGDHFHLADDDNKPEPITVNQIIEFKDVIVSDWLPQYPGLFFTRYFWEHPGNLKKQVKMADHKIEDTNIQFISINKLNERFAHSDISNAIPAYFVVDEIADDDKSWLKSNFEEFGASCFRTLKLLVESLEILDYEEGLDHNPIINMRFRIIDFQFETDSCKKPLQGNLGIIYYDDGLIKQSLEHFWIGIPEYKDTLSKALQKLHESIPQTAIVLLERRLFNQLILETGTSLGPFLDELEDIFQQTGVEIVSKDFQGITVSLHDPQQLSDQHILGSFLASIIFHDSIVSFDIRTPSASDTVKKTMFFHVRKVNEPGLNFWGFIHFILSP
ncbi:MAG TPA: hypothetical protein VKM55_30375 [Candidatus Lokiarchaeia archaeon]|nr:hypothetical protein [Candidatus Lokiarchaeia archaeon]